MYSRPKRQRAGIAHGRYKALAVRAGLLLGSIELGVFRSSVDFSELRTNGVQPWPGSAINIMEVGAEALSSVISLSLTKFLLGDLVFRVKSGLTARRTPLNNIPAESVLITRSPVTPHWQRDRRRRCRSDPVFAQEEAAAPLLSMPRSASEMVKPRRRSYESYPGKGFASKAKYSPSGVTMKSNPMKVNPLIAW
jgi:hypothetical protein